MFNSKKMIGYSVMASTIIGGNSKLIAQAIYFDVDPDTLLNSTEDYDFDINFDGDYNFRFSNLEWTWYFSYWGGDLYQHILEIIPFGPDNSVAGYSDYIADFAYAEENSNFINSSLNFIDNYQLLAYRKIPLDWSFYYLFYGGLWYPEKIDHYLGIRFLDADTCMHYGWIRCDVLDEGRKLIIKDYAYESRCNTGIAAGDTVGFIPEIILDSTIIIHPDEIISNELVGVSAYSFNGNVFIQLPDQYHTYHLKIIGLKGDILYEKDLLNLVNEVTVPLNNSIILIQLQCEGKFYTKKIFL